MPVNKKSRKMSRKYLALLKKKNASHLPSKTHKNRRTRRQRGGMGWAPPPPPHGWAFNHPHGRLQGTLARHSISSTTHHKGGKKQRNTKKHKGGMGRAFNHPHGRLSGQLTMPHTHPSHSIDWNNPPHSFFPQRRYNRGGSCGKTHQKRKLKGGSAGWNGPAGGAPGFSWWSNPGTWPGVAASMGLSQNGMAQSNHLPLSKYGIPAGVGGEGGPNDPPVSTRNANAGPNNGGTAYQNANNGQPGPPLTNIDVMK
jgi:hypothetical protein